MLSSKQLKPRKCAVCREEYTPRRIGLKITKVCLNAACVLDWAQGVRAKDLKRQEREQAMINAQKKRDFLANDIRHQKEKAQKAFNKYIRLRDAELECISCDKPAVWGGQWHAGHFKTVGARPDLRFNEDNVHKQCSVCNNHLSGNLNNYRDGLIAKIGIERVLALDVVGEPVKYTAQHYASIAKVYSELCKKFDSKD